MIGNEVRHLCRPFTNSHLVYIKAHFSLRSLLLLEGNHFRTIDNSIFSCVKLLFSSAGNSEHHDSLKKKHSLVLSDENFTQEVEFSIVQKR